MTIQALLKRPVLVKNPTNTSNNCSIVFFETAGRYRCQCPFRIPPPVPLFTLSKITEALLTMVFVFLNGKSLNLKIKIRVSPIGGQRTSSPIKANLETVANGVFLSAGKILDWLNLKLPSKGYKKRCNYWHISKKYFISRWRIWTSFKEKRNYLWLRVIFFYGGPLGPR